MIKTHFNDFLNKYLSFLFYNELSDWSVAHSRNLQSHPLLRFLLLFFYNLSDNISTFKILRNQVLLDHLIFLVKPFFLMLSSITNVILRMTLVSAWFVLVADSEIFENLSFLGEKNQNIVNKPQKYREIQISQMVQKMLSWKPLVKSHHTDIWEARLDNLLIKLEAIKQLFT